MHLLWCTHVEIRRQLARIDSLLPPNRIWGLNSDCLAQQQMLLLASVISLTPKHIHAWNHSLIKAFRITHSNELLKCSWNWWTLVIIVFLEYFYGAMFRVRRYFKIPFTSPFVAKKENQSIHCQTRMKWLISNHWGTHRILLEEPLARENSFPSLSDHLGPWPLLFSSLKENPNILGQAHLLSQPTSMPLYPPHTPTVQNRLPPYALELCKSLIHCVLSLTVCFTSTEEWKLGLCILTKNSSK